MEVYCGRPADISHHGVRPAPIERITVPDIAFLNGRFVPYADAVIPIDDRGFQFGDGVYEVIRTYHGRPFELDAHLARLERSAHALDLPQPYSRSQWTQ